MGERERGRVEVCYLIGVGSWRGGGGAGLVGTRVVLKVPPVKIVLNVPQVKIVLKVLRFEEFL